MKRICQRRHHGSATRQRFPRLFKISLVYINQGIVGCSWHCQRQRGKEAKWNPQRIPVPTTETFNRLGFDWTFLRKETCSRSLSSQPSQQQREEVRLFPDKTRHWLKPKAQCAVRTKLHPLSQSISDSYQQCSELVQLHCSVWYNHSCSSFYSITWAQFNPSIVPHEKFIV